MQTPSWVTDDAYWKERCRRLIGRANDLIEGRVSALELGREFSEERFWFRADNDPDFLTFTAIDSETDHLPIGAAREHWAQDALVQKDIEIERAEATYRAHAIEAAHNLITKYRPFC